VHGFFKTFTAKLEGLRTTLADIEQAGCAGSDPAELASRLEALGNDTQAVKDFANAGSHHLPPYDQRSMQMKLDKFDEDKAEVQSRLVPRKKFAFKRKDKKKPAAANVVAAEAGSTHSNAAIVAGEAETRVTTKSTIQVAHDIERSLVGRKGETIVMDGDRLAGCDFFIAQCTGCTILLQGCMGALRMEHVTNCVIMTGPVKGACHVEAADGTTFHMAAHQLRLHHSKSCDFYLHTRSHPIIEDCTELRFAPYALEYEGLAVELDQAGLGAADCGENWCQVKDFKWLRQQQSPNWCVLPEVERVTPKTDLDFTLGTS